MALDTKSTLDPLRKAEPDLGVLRTMMAADRTLMAWIRTSLSMLSFGYTIYKVLEEIHEIGKIPVRVEAPRNAGILLTVSGTVALIMGVVEYWVTLRSLSRSYPFKPLRPSLVMSIVLACAGVLLSVGIITRAL